MPDAPCAACRATRAWALGKPQEYALIFGSPIPGYNAPQDTVDPAAMAEATARSIPGARYVELRTGHYMSVQTPDLIADAIDDFLRSVEA